MNLLPEGREYCELTKEPRRVGFELEFAGLSLEAVAEQLANSLDGEIIPNTKAECSVETADLGSFKVELDWQQGKLLAEERLKALREETGETHPEDPVMEWIAETASQIVPMEVVCPPVPVNRLNELDPMIEALREAGAIGTRGSSIYAFGVHINPELPDVETQTISNYLKAFCVAQDWLIEKHDVDLSRRITPYIDLYSSEYIKAVLTEPSDGALDQIITQYIAHNPTRNRALDMTPLFKHLDRDKIETSLGDDRINARPTFHYRLPNCNIEKEGWNLNTSWSVWCVVEHLASNPELLTELSNDWLKNSEELFIFEQPPWFTKLEAIHKDLVQ